MAKVSDHTQRKIIAPKLMLRRLPAALAQVQAGNASELNEICQFVYFLYQAK